MKLLAQELRIGNYVNCPNKNIPWFCITEFEYLNAYDCKVGMQFIPKTHPYTWLLKDLSPIPLTNEWYLRLGFENDQINGWKINITKNAINPRFIFIDSEDRLNVVDSDGYGIVIAYHVKYVHRLQNLYYTLTEEELIRKE